MEGTIPFLSPFPLTAHPAVSSRESSPSSSSGAISALNDVVRAVNSDSTDCSHQRGALPSMDGGKEEDEGEEDVFYEVTVDVSGSKPVSSTVIEQRATVPAKPVGIRDIVSSQLEVIASAANAVLLSTLGEKAKTIISRAEGEGEREREIGVTSHSPSPSPSALPIIPKNLGLISRYENDVEGASSSGGGKIDLKAQEELGLLFTSAPSRFASSLEFLIGDSSLKKNKNGVFSGITSSFVSNDDIGANKGKPKISVSPKGPIISESDCSEVGDRLLAIAEQLLSIEHPASCVDKSQRRLPQVGVDEKGNGGPSEAEGLRESLTAENRLRTDTAKKLLLLAKVLSGRHPMSEYRALYDEAA
jgi:hypothetical protein